MRWLDDDPDDDEPVVPDEPFCGELDDHLCLGANCPRRPAGRNLGYCEAPESDIEAFVAEQPPTARAQRCEVSGSDDPIVPTSSETRDTFMSVMMG